MKRALISSDNSLLRNVAGVAVAMLVIPTALLAALIVAPFARPVKRSSVEVLRFLRNFHDGTGDDYDWDDFTSVSIADAELEVIRASAASLDLPMSDDGLQSLKALIAKTEAMVPQHSVL
jgi:hypothetical protein